ncbi:hypothetical protein [Amphibacillus cookii]|uniref:hypothetical protein n=1 Tax=Amphibacillus cookii TaxID=767787 RepID=UPI00195713AC|nr:hypothetical protein [Amphibacillus cookii]MBM7540038.1 hypothetical protein [Amphibacillus cookii]
MERYTPYWPENLFIIGADASINLKIKSTYQIAKAISRLGETSGSDQSLKQVFSDTSDQVIEAIHQFIKILKGETPDQSDYSPKRINELRVIYDWDALMQILTRCPKDKHQIIHIEDAYNLIDMHLQTGHGFSGNKENPIRPERMIAARNLLNLLTVLFHSTSYQNMLRDHKNILDQYTEFTEVLALLMQQEGLMRANEQTAFDDRAFYLFSYSVLSMNWDPIFLWLIFNAHKKVNQAPPLYW